MGAAGVGGGLVVVLSHSLSEVSSVFCFDVEFFFDVLITEEKPNFRFVLKGCQLTSIWDQLESCV